MLINVELDLTIKVFSPVCTPLIYALFLLEMDTSERSSWKEITCWRCDILRGVSTVIPAITLQCVSARDMVTWCEATSGAVPFLDTQQWPDPIALAAFIKKTHRNRTNVQHRCYKTYKHTQIQSMKTLIQTIISLRCAIVLSRSTILEKLIAYSVSTKKKKKTI